MALGIWDATSLSLQQTITTAATPMSSLMVADIKQVMQATPFRQAYNI